MLLFCYVLIQVIQIGLKMCFSLLDDKPPENFNIFS